MKEGLEEEREVEVVPKEEDQIKKEKNMTAQNGDLLLNWEDLLILDRSSLSKKSLNFHYQLKKSKLLINSLVKTIKKKL